MLRCKKRGWGKYCYLLSSLNCLEGCANCDFGLAETNVTADESVHWDVALHVGFDINDGGPLIGCFNKTECILHFRLPRCIRSKCMPGSVDALLVENDQLLGNFLNRRTNPSFGRCKIATTETVERGSLATRVGPEYMYLVRRNV